MNIDFSAEYAKRSDDELLRLASERASLTDDALVALDQELSRRRLTKSDEERFQLVEKRDRSRQAKKVLRRALETQRGREEWLKDLVRILSGVLVIALVSAVYQRLPGQYQLSDDKQQAAFIVMCSTVLIGMLLFSWWRKGHFWLSLVLAIVLHFAMLQTWLMSPGTRNESTKAAILLGPVLFLATYGFLYSLRKKFAAGRSAEDPHVSV